tara:strand:+ start:31636 stop:32313 length:678 start_codon:yes stop_codon:yes gene_type:complete
MTPFQTLIIAGGDMSPPDIPSNIATHQTLLCLDGAATVVQRYKITPDIILGDLDTLVIQYANIRQIQAAFPKSTIVHTPDQNKTDFEKALDYVVQHNLGTVLCLGLLGKAMDHTLSNLSLFARYSTIVPLTLLHSFENQKQWGFMLPPKCCIHTQINQTTSLIPISEAIVSSKGLKWELEHAKLNPLSFNSVRNKTQSEQLFIETQGNCLYLQCSEQMPRLEILD